MVEAIMIGIEAQAFSTVGAPLQVLWLYHACLPALLGSEACNHTKISIPYKYVSIYIYIWKVWKPEQEQDVMKNKENQKRMS